MMDAIDIAVCALIWSVALLVVGFSVWIVLNGIANWRDS